MHPSPKLLKFLGWFIAIAVILVLAFGAVRIVLNPWYVYFAYNVLGIPADTYGFTTERRIDYALTAVEYLNNDAGIEFLGDLRFPAGEEAPAESCINIDLYQGDCTRVYNARELEHMLDVKIVLGQVFWVLGILLGVLVLLGLWAWRGSWLAEYKHALGRGGWLTIALIVIILVLVLVAFVPFFVFFHQVFFESGTWMFLWSDTLIRLFPMAFWQYTFITVGAIAALGGLALGLLFAPITRKS